MDGAGSIRTTPEPDLVPRPVLARLLRICSALRETLLLIAHRHTRRHRQDAEDLFMSTLTTALDPAYAGWRRHDYPDALTYLGSVMNGIARNRRRSSYDALRADLDEPRAPAVPAPAADPEAHLLMMGTERTRQEMEAAVRARVADKPVPRAVLEWTARGVKGNLALAEKMGCDIGQVVAAKKLLQAYAKAVAAERASRPEVA